EIRSAVIWYKACSVTRPDYFVEYLPENPWIHQPFEMYDEITLDRLATK
ncbi:MAG: phosphoribosyltransferase, partial [Betaproteobacteria bacterium]